MNNIHLAAVWNISRANSPMLFQEIIGWWSMNLSHASRATSDRLAYSVRKLEIFQFLSKANLKNQSAETQLNLSFMAVVLNLKRKIGLSAKLI